MILYPTTVLFRLARAIERALAGLKAGRPLPPAEAMDLGEFEDVVGLAGWQEVEERFSKG
jgi:hypothetical protein